jgi:hypothetical protein
LSTAQIDLGDDAAARGWVYQNTGPWADADQRELIRSAHRMAGTETTPWPVVKKRR